MNKLLLEYLNASNDYSSNSSSRTSSCDSSNSNNSKNYNKYKTELCRTYEEKGYCPYGGKCRFAHGKEDLVPRETQPMMKKRCNGFWMNGCCSYGRRCRFGHEEHHWESRALLMGLEAQCLPAEESYKCSKLMKLLH